MACHGRLDLEDHLASQKAVEAYLRTSVAGQKMFQESMHTRYSARKRGWEASSSSRRLQHGIGLTSVGVG